MANNETPEAKRGRGRKQSVAKIKETVAATIAQLGGVQRAGVVANHAQQIPAAKESPAQSSG